MQHIRSLLVSFISKQFSLKSDQRGLLSAQLYIHTINRNDVFLYAHHTIWKAVSACFVQFWLGQTLTANILNILVTVPGVQCSILPLPPPSSHSCLALSSSLSLLISPVCSHSWLVEIPRVVPPSCSRNSKHLLLISQSPQQYLRTGFSSPLLPDCSASSSGNMRLARKKLLVHFWFHALTLFLVCLQETPGVFLCCSSYLGFVCFFTAAPYAPSKLPAWSWQAGNCLPACLLLHYICCSRNIFFVWIFLHK